VVATSPLVDLVKEFYSLLAGDAPHEDTRGATLVHLAVDEDKGLGTAT
jgi:hypothetical protein